MQTSFPSWLKYINKNIHVSFVTSAEFSSLLDGHDHIDSVYGYKRKKGLSDIKELRSFVQRIHKEKPIDFIIDLHGTTRSFFLKLVNFEIPSLAPDKRRLERFFLLKLKWDLMRKMPSIHSRNIVDLMGSFTTDEEAIENYKQSIKQHFSNTEIGMTTPTLKNIPRHIDGDYIVIAPVASFAPKRWSIESFKELILAILEDESFAKYKVVNLAGPTDHFCQAFDSIRDERFSNLQGKTSLKESSEIIANASLLIGNDSGLGHIAESYGVRVISIFGPTSESLGFRPHLPGSRTVSKKLWCRPCSPTGKRKCFRKKQYCMEEIVPEDIISLSREVLC